LIVIIRQCLSSIVHGDVSANGQACESWLCNNGFGVTVGDLSSSNQYMTDRRHPSALCQSDCIPFIISWSHAAYRL